MHRTNEFVVQATKSMLIFQLLRLFEAAFIQIRLALRQWPLTMDHVLLES